MPITLDGSNGIDSPDLNITGTGARITGDFSNATIANRVLLQTSTTNSATTIGAIPNGTNPSAQLTAYNNSDPTNSARVYMSVNAAEAQVGSTIVGTGSYVPLVFHSGGFERLRIDTTGNILVAQASRGTIVTDNDLSFDLNASSNFTCTPSAGGALTFTNIASAAGQSGYVLLINSGGYSITAAAATKENASFLSTISTTGTYLISYFCDGTNVYCTTSGAMT